MEKKKSISARCPQRISEVKVKSGVGAKDILSAYDYPTSTQFPICMPSNGPSQRNNGENKLM